eukprot:6209079-Pleurochrysis_carterae.AAC.2
MAKYAYRAAGKCEQDSLHESQVGLARPPTARRKIANYWKQSCTSTLGLLRLRQRASRRAGFKPVAHLRNESVARVAVAGGS